MLTNANFDSSGMITLVSEHYPHRVRQPATSSAKWFTFIGSREGDDNVASPGLLCGVSSLLVIP